MAVITISRQFGSGGDDLAAELCRVLGYQYFDKTMIAQAAADLDLSAEKIVDFSEDTYKVRGFMDRLLSWPRPDTIAQVKTWAVDVAGVKTEKVIDLDETHSTALVRATIETAYERNNVVIVGRGGQAILADKPDVLHLRVVAPLSTRVQRLVNRANMSHGGAKDAALKHDITSADYLERFHNIDWTDPVNYDLVINTGKLSIETAARLVAETVTTLSKRVNAMI